MNKLLPAVFLIFAISGALRYANENYEDIRDGLISTVQGATTARQERQENEITQNLAMITDPAYLFFDAPEIVTTDRYNTYRTPDTQARDAAIAQLDRFLDHAFDGGRDWQGASVRVLTISGAIKLWLTDLRRERDGTMSGQIMRMGGDNQRMWVRLGRRYTFEHSEVRDWAITHEGQVYGLFSIRYNLELLPPDIAALAAANLSDDAVPQGW